MKEKLLPPTPNLEYKLLSTILTRLQDDWHDLVEACNENWIKADAQGGSSVSILTATVSLTSARIKTLDLTPVTIVPAPGVGKLLIPVFFFIQYKFNSAAYVVPNSPSPSFFYGSAASPKLIQGYNDNPGNKLFTSTGPNDLFTIAPLSPTQNPSIAGWFAGNVIFAEPFDAAIFTNQPIVFGHLLGNPMYNAGPITGLTVADNSTCTGYLAGDTFTIDAGAIFQDTSDATGHVVTASGGKPLTIAIDTPGVSYSVTTANPGTGPYPTAHTSGIGNDALKVNVTSATVGDGTAVVSIQYQIITL